MLLLFGLAVVSISQACFCPSRATSCACSQPAYSSYSYSPGYSYSGHRSYPSYPTAGSGYPHAGHGSVSHPQGAPYYPGARTVFFRQPYDVVRNYYSRPYGGPGPQQPRPFVPQQPIQPYNPPQTSYNQGPQVQTQQKWTEQYKAVPHNPIHEPTQQIHQVNVPQSYQEQQQLVYTNEANDEVPSQPEVTYEQQSVQPQQEVVEVVTEPSTYSQTTQSSVYTTSIVPIKNKEGKSDDFEYFYVYYDEDDERAKSKIHEGAIDGGYQATTLPPARPDYKYLKAEVGAPNTFEAPVEVVQGEVDITVPEEPVHVPEQVHIDQPQTVETATDAAPGDFSYYEVPAEQIFNPESLPSTYQPAETTQEPTTVTFEPLTQEYKESSTIASIAQSTESKPEYEYEEYEVEEIVPIYEDGSEGKPEVVKIITTTKAPYTEVVPVNNNNVEYSQSPIAEYTTLTTPVVQSTEGNDVIFPEEIQVNAASSEFEESDAYKKKLRGARHAKTNNAN